MKNKIRTEESNNQIIEYLTQAAAHGGYYFDGIKIEPGTAVTCLKTIASQTNLSYYRVKKCIGRLVESGRVTIVRHKCFAVITFCAAPQQEVHEEANETVQADTFDGQAPIAEAMSSNVPEISAPDVERLAGSDTLPTLSVTTPPVDYSRPVVPALSTNPPLPILNRAARRKLARQEAKAAARRANHGRVGV